MELNEYIKPIRKWWWLMLLATLLAGGTSYLATRQQPPIYETRTTLMIGSTINDPNPDGWEFFLAQQLAETYTSIAQRSPVREATMAALNLTWLPGYSVRTVNNSHLLEIIVQDTDPVRVQAVANELAHQLIVQSPTTTDAEEQERVDFVNTQLNQLEVQIEETQTEVGEKQENLGSLFSARQIADAEDEIAALLRKLTTLQSNYALMLASAQQGSINTLTVIESAVLPNFPVGPNRNLTILVSSLIGLALATGAAYLLEYLDDTIKSTEDVKRYADLPTLAAIVNQRDLSHDVGPTAINHPRSPVTEAYRSLRTGLQFTNLDHRNRTILVTSTNPGDGKSTTAANLAAVMAQAGQRVLLIDADMRRPRLHKLFGLSNRAGLTNYVLDMVDEDSSANGHHEELVRPTEQENLWVLTTGLIPPNPSELLGTKRMRAAIESFAEYYDYVIIDSPPIMAVTDPVILSTYVDGVLFAVYADKTRRNHLKFAVQKLRDVNANPLGVVMNRTSSKSESYQYYYYQYEAYTSDPTVGQNGQGPNDSGGRQKRRLRFPRRRPVAAGPSKT